MMKRIGAILMGMFLLSGIAFGRDLGTVGKVYPITERDALQELEGRVKQVNWSKELSKIKPEKYRPENSVSLPRAAKNRTFTVDMTYTLNSDIPDGKGGILYPKGYRFNPLDYLNFPKTLVVINGEDPDQVEWFRVSTYHGRPDVMFLITSGSYVELGKRLGRAVFYADSRIVDRFNLQSVPAVIRQSGRAMEVREIDVKHHKKKG